MDPALRRPMSLEGCLAWEKRQEPRHEFDPLRPVALTGGTLAHAAIQRNLAISVDGRLRGRPCDFFGSDLKVLTASTTRYPDGLVTCIEVPLAELDDGLDFSASDAGATDGTRRRGPPAWTGASSPSPPA